MFKSIMIWGREFSLKVIFEALKEEGILAEQNQALDEFIDKSEKLLSDTNAIETYCVEKSNGKLEYPVDNIFKYVIPTRIYVTRNTNIRQVVLLCNYKFDEESGCALVFENEKLMKICTQEDIQFL